MTKQTTVEPQTVTLRDQRTVTIRALEEGDRDAMMRFGAALPNADWRYLELDFHNPNTINRLVNAAAAENWRQVVAVAEEQIVGYSNAQLLPGWKSHVADTHLVVSQE